MCLRVLSSIERTFLKTWLLYSILMVQAIFFRIFWAFFAIFSDKNDFLIFFPFDFHTIHICIAGGAKLSFASVLRFVYRTAPKCHWAFLFFHHV